MDLIADDRFSGVLESRDTMVQGLKPSYPVYEELYALAASKGVDLTTPDA